MIGGKLYLSGGFVDAFNVPQLPASLTFGFALSIRVPDQLLGKEVSIKLSFSGGPNDQLATLQTSLTVQKNPSKLPDSDQRIAVAFPQINLMVEAEGIFVARAIINGEELGRIPFRVQHIAQ